MTRTEMKRFAQDELLHGVSVVLGYFEEDPAKCPAGWDQWPEEKRDEYRSIIKREGDRVAKLFGYEEAWRS